MGKYDIGKRFQTRQGEWFTIVDRHKYGRQCTIQFDDCDGEYIVYTSNIYRQNIAHPSRMKQRHGDRYTKLWKEWNTMLWRCNPKNITHKRWYYDKGIVVCGEWHNYLNFKEWALNNGYQPNLTIDRIDSDKNYCPQNCQWITLSENVTKSSTRAVIAVDLINNTTQTFESIKDAAQYFHCHTDTIQKKLKGKSVKISSLHDDILLFYATDYCA